MADGGLIETLRAGNVGIAASLKKHLPDEFLLMRLQLGDGTVQPLIILTHVRTQAVIFCYLNG